MPRQPYGQPPSDEQLEQDPRGKMVAAGEAIVEAAERAQVSQAEIVRAWGWSLPTSRRYCAAYKATRRHEPALPTGPEIDAAVFDPDDMYEADVEDLLELIRLKQHLDDQHDPVITHATIEVETDRPVPILLAGCFQIGGRWTFHRFIQEQLEEMFSLPHARLGTFGDEVENFVSGSFAGARSVYEQALTPPLQRLLWSRWMDKYADRILWGTASQHGTQWNERTGHNPIKDKYLEHDIPFFDGMGYVKLRVGRQTYNIAMAHEFPGSSMYNPTHAQKRALWQRYPNADIIAQADRHIYAASEEYVYSNEYLAGNRHSPYVWLVQIGTAKDGPDPYTIRGWERGVSEWPWLVLWPDEFKVKVTRDFDDVRLWCGA